MDAFALMKGDKFADCDPDTWEEASSSQRNRISKVHVESDPVECPSDRGRVHLRTSAGHWCAPRVRPVTLLAQ